MDAIIEHLTNRQAANYLGVAAYTLKQSRSTGVLCGKESPPFRKLGVRKVIYHRSDLDAWLDNFPVYRNTSALPPAGEKSA